MHTQPWTGRWPCAYTCLQTHKRTHQLRVGHQTDRQDYLPEVYDKDPHSAGWSPVSNARLAAAQTWRCTGTGAHLRFAGLDQKQSHTLRSGGGSVGACALRSCRPTPRGVITKPFTRIPARVSTDSECPDHVGVNLHRHMGVTWHTNA